MASSKVMASSSAPNSDLPRRQQPLPSHSQSPSSIIHSFTSPPPPPPSSSASVLHPDHYYSTGTLGSMNMDEILKNIYSDSDTFATAAAVAGDANTASGSSVPPLDGGASGVKGKTADEVWKDIVTGGGRGPKGEPEMTLEDFLTKAGAVSEEDVRPQPVTAVAGGGFAVDTMMGGQYPAVHMQNGMGAGAGGGFGMEVQIGYGNGAGGMVPVVGSASGPSGGRGKRRATVEEAPLDKATQQKQRRMIKNRESAARSRERKQAYTVELESLVTQLEEENARLLKEEAEHNKERLKQLMENLIPVVEKRRPPRVLRRVQSM